MRTHEEFEVAIRGAIYQWERTTDERNESTMVATLYAEERDKAVAELAAKDRRIAELTDQLNRSLANTDRCIEYTDRCIEYTKQLIEMVKNYNQKGTP